MPRAPVASPARAQCPRLGLWQGLGLGAHGHGAVPGDPAVLGLQSPEPLTLHRAAAVPKCRLEPWQGARLSNYLIS